MKRWIITIVGLVLPCLVHTAFAADAPETAPEAHANALRAGVWALQLDVNGPLLDVAPLSGGVSLKRQFSTKSALRFGVGLAATVRTTTPNVDTEPDRETDTATYRISVQTLYQYYFNPEGILNVYVAVGPTASFYRRTDDTELGFFWNHEEATFTSWSVGGIVALGGEWFFTHQFSLLAEYSTSGAYSRLEDDRIGSTSEGDVISYSNNVYTDWAVSLSGVRLGLSVYF